MLKCTVSCYGCALKRFLWSPSIFLLLASAKEHISKTLFICLKYTCCNIHIRSEVKYFDNNNGVCLINTLYSFVKFSAPAVNNILAENALAIFTAENNVMDFLLLLIFRKTFYFLKGFFFSFYHFFYVFLQFEQHYYYLGRVYRDMFYLHATGCYQPLLFTSPLTLTVGGHSFTTSRRPPCKHINGFPPTDSDNCGLLEPNWRNCYWELDLGFLLWWHPMPSVHSLGDILCWYKDASFFDAFGAITVYSGLLVHLSPLADLGRWMLSTDGLISLKRDLLFRKMTHSARG